MFSSASLRRPVLGAVAASLVAPATAAAACPDAGVRPAGERDLPRFERSVMCLINQERAERGRALLAPDPRLAVAAQRHADDMVRRRYFSHRSMGGSRVLERLRRAGYGAQGQGLVYGEILGWGVRGASKPSALVRAWMRSPTHRAALLDPRFRELGAGATQGAPVAPRSGVTAAVTFGRLR